MRRWREEAKGATGEKPGGIGVVEGGGVLTSRLSKLRDEIAVGREEGREALEIDVAFTARQWRITGRKEDRLGEGFRSPTSVSRSLLTHRQK
ncbi:hypothetical protein Pcinc_018063 [Petrolisthes cinctipes]|uniref:Uncharacterized protein n=1 Tax=Petrolisthes cinctipes TaxID=88211 RepID=A0AAE1FMU4_PETCI|nr:hypothetical protein Pcinc_037398 [Petrolisthes cinctipes]KAK3877212.1 hypothetical protein Pcinc_018063 [Petrolisthes cinctipes]